MIVAVVIEFLSDDFVRAMKKHIAQEKRERQVQPSA
jgi:hypothetical protein